VSSAHQLRTRLHSGELIVAPGAWDGISARLVEQAGYPAVYMTGAGVSAARGFPDFGLVTMSEMAESAGVLTRSVGIPVIADTDTGYGNSLNVRRTVQEYEMRGVAALQIEDQASPKRCGHLDGKELITTGEFVEKISAAVAAKRDSDLVIIARTDARAVTSLDDAIERVNRALAAGADIAFVEAPRSLDEAVEVACRVDGPCLLNLVPGGKTPNIALDVAAHLGFRMVILPGLVLTALMRAGDQALASLRDQGCAPAQSASQSISALFDRLGAREWQAVPVRASHAAE